MKKLLFSIGLAALLVTSVEAQTTAAGKNIINSAKGNTNITTVATNGLYTASISPATTETNLVCLNPGPTADYGNTISLQFSAAPLLTTSSNTAVFVLSAATAPLTINAPSTNSYANANWNTATGARCVIATITLALTTAGVQATTNIVLAPTTGYCAGTKLYIETIGMGSASTGNFMTNYQVSAISGK